jgi:hypothetical protein
VGAQIRQNHLIQVVAKASFMKENKLIIRVIEPHAPTLNNITRLRRVSVATRPTFLFLVKPTTAEGFGARSAPKYHV